MASRELLAEEVREMGKKDHRGKLSFLGQHLPENIAELAPTVFFSVASR